MGDLGQSGARTYVPFALPMDQAEHVWGAVEAVLKSCREAGRPVTEYAPLSAALITMTTAMTKARATPPKPPVGADGEHTPRGRSAT